MLNFKWPIFPIKISPWQSRAGNIVLWIIRENPATIVTVANKILT